MGINVANIGNKKILAYKLPSHYKNEDNFIGNKLEDFIILQILGQGGGGFVAKVKSKINLEIYALKKINFSKIAQEEEKKKLKNEILFLKYFDHPNVCKCLTTFEEDGCVYMVMNLFNNKDVYRYLKAYRDFNFQINEEKLWDIFHQCFEGLIYLHNLGVIHRDIKPANIFMDDKGNLKIGDFGNCAVINKKEALKFTNNPQEQELLLFQSDPNIGTLGYKAPEIQYGQEYNQKADVYSLGVSFFVLCYFQYPDNNLNILRNDMNYSSELRKIIFYMVQPDPNQRPNLSDIYCFFNIHYIQKYVKKSGIYSVITCLFNFDIFKTYFSSEFHLNQIIDTQMPKKFTYAMIEIIQSLKNKNELSKKIYILRKFLNEEGIIKKDIEEYSPIEVLITIINSLNRELNTAKDLSKSQVLPKIRTEEEESKSKYLHKDDIPGEEKKKYDEFVSSYKNNFNSMISRNFSGTLKITRECYNSHINYLFRRFFYIHFDCELLMKQLGKNMINILEAFNCLNKNKISLDLDRHVKCPNCQKKNKHTETRRFYETPDNLILIFDRGENNKNKLKININEMIEINRTEVERSLGKCYYLVGAISEIMKNGKSKYISFIKNNYNWALYDIDEEEDQITDNFNNIKNIGNIICLFYYCYPLDSF